MTLEQATALAAKRQATFPGAWVEIIQNDWNDYSVSVDFRGYSGEPICEAISTQRGNIQSLYTWGH